MDPEPASSSWAQRLIQHKATLGLVFQGFGIVYGDLSTSPIYVFSSTFSRSLRVHKEDDEILGILSLVIWTLTLVPLCKYVVFVLNADDNGEGGTFALYSLLSRRAKVGLLSSSHGPEDIVPVEEETKTSAAFKDFLGKHCLCRVILVLMVFLGTSMVIADGVLTPAMSVISAVHGLKIKVEGLHENYALMITGLILVGLFALQHFGTHRVGFIFAPVILAWLMSISGIGLYNTIRWNPGIVRALSPSYAYNFFRKTRGGGWSSLGGVVLCIAGSESMFADLGHFTKLSIRIAFAVVVYPCLILAYMGEAAYLSKHKEDLTRSFYKAIPGPAFWPVFIIATLATVVGSQAVISATFSVISQCRALKCFPRVKIIHTSDQVHGQVYIPEVNWILMVLCLTVAICFRDQNTIGNAYGLAVIIVMLVTTCLMFLVIIVVWKRSALAAFAFVIVFGSVELLYSSACIANVHKGGWLLLILGLVTFSTMCTWYYGTLQKQSYEMENGLRLQTLLSLGPDLGVNRVPGIGLIYTNVTSAGLPPMFTHFITNFPAVHKVLVCVTIQNLSVPQVPPNQRFIVSRIGPAEFRLYRCIVRFGYKDERNDFQTFQTQLIDALAEFLRHIDNSNAGPAVGNTARFRNVGCREELNDLALAQEAGLAYMMGNTHVLAREASSFVKKFLINVLYGFLRRNCRRPATALGVPHTALIEVGLLYQV